MDDLLRENAQLRRLVSDLIFGSTFTTSPGKEPRPMLALPIPCECGNTIIQQFTFGDPMKFTFTDARIDLEAHAQLEGKVTEISFHGIQFHEGKLCCAKCGRKVMQKDWPDTGINED